MTPALSPEFRADVGWTERRLLWIGHGVLLSLLTLAAGGIGTAIWMGMPWAILAPAAVAAACLAFALLLRHPLLHLAVVLSLALSSVSTDPGIQPSEVIYGLYYFSYLAGWFCTRVFVHRKPVAPHMVDKMFLAFLVGVGLSSILSVLFGASATAFAAEGANLLLLGFYFPVRAAVAEHRHGAMVIAGVIALLALAVSLRNIANYRSLVTAAVLAEVIGGRRVDMNNALVLLGVGMGIGLATTLRHRWKVLAALIGLGAVIAAALITQSRALWAVGLGMGGLAFLLVNSTEKRRIALGSLLLTGALGILLMALVGDKIFVIAQSFVRRFSTLGQAASSDISLLSRYYEGKYVLGEALKSPVVGHGIGVPYAQYEIIEQVTFKRTFVHNGYISLLYRFGIWGLVLVVAAWLSSVSRSLRAMRQTSVPFDRGMALGCVVLLLGALVYHNTSNLLQNSDGVLVLMLAWAVGNGLDARSTRAEPGRP